MPEVQINELVTTGYLTQLFRRSTLTITHWRTRDGMPYIRIKGYKRDTIRYQLASVLEWARRRGKRVFPSESACG
jgi:hypothetical protein